MLRTALVGSCLGLFAFTLCAAGGPTLSAPQDWPRFRGPNGAGVGVANLPAKWTEKDYNWRATLPGVGHSSPVVWGDRVFVTCGENETAKRIVLCLKTSDGRVAWRRDFDSKREQRNPDNSYASSTPAVDADHVYVAWTAPEETTLLALTHDGKEVWRRGLGPFVSTHGSGTSPILVGDLVVLGDSQEVPERVKMDVPPKSSIVALDAKTGEIRWRTDQRTTRVFYSTPIVCQLDGEPPQLIFTSTSHGFTSLDPSTGKINWEVPDTMPERCVGSPLFASGLIFASCGTGGAGRHVVAVRPGSKKAGTPPQIAYTVQKPVPYVPTPVAKDGLVYLWGDDGLVTCIRAATGEQVWQQRVGSNFYGSPVIVGDRLYCTSRQGDVFVLAAGEKPELLARNPLGEPSHATPAVANGVLYLRTLSHLISIGPAK